MVVLCITMSPTFSLYDTCRVKVYNQVSLRPKHTIWALLIRLHEKTFCQIVSLRRKHTIWALIIRMYEKIVCQIVSLRPKHTISALLIRMYEKVCFRTKHTFCNIRIGYNNFVYFVHEYANCHIQIVRYQFVCFEQKRSSCDIPIGSNCVVYY